MGARVTINLGTDRVVLWMEVVFLKSRCMAWLQTAPLLRLFWERTHGSQERSRQAAGREDKWGLIGGGRGAPSLGWVDWEILTFPREGLGPPAEGPERPEAGG